MAFALWVSVAAYLPAFGQSVTYSVEAVTDTSGTPNTSAPGAPQGAPGYSNRLFNVGQTVRVTMKAVNTSSSTGAWAMINVRDASTQVTRYRSPGGSVTALPGSATGNSADSPLTTSETDYYSFDVNTGGWPTGNYDVSGTFRPSSSSNTIIDSTDSGANTQVGADWWRLSQFTLQSPQPLALPNNFSVSPLSGTTATLNWSWNGGTNNAQRIELALVRTDTLNGTTLQTLITSTVLPVTQTSADLHTLSGNALVPGLFYRANVAYIPSAGFSGGGSASYSFQTPPLSPPSSLSRTVTNDLVSYGWGSVSLATEYRLQARKTGAAWPADDASAATSDVPVNIKLSNTWFDWDYTKVDYSEVSAPPIPGQGYEWRVKSIYVSGGGTWASSAWTTGSSFTVLSNLAPVVSVLTATSAYGEVTSSFTVTDANGDPLRYDAQLTATNTPGTAKISGTQGIGTGYASIGGSQQQITFTSAHVNGMLADGVQYYVRIKSFDPSFEANGTSYHEVFVPFTFDTFAPNPLGAGVEVLHNKKLLGTLCIDGTSPAPPGAQKWDWFVLRNADTNAALAFADANGFADTVDFTRLIWRLPTTGAPALDWASVLPSSGTVRLRIDGYYTSATVVSSAAFIAQRQSVLSASISCPTSLFPRYLDTSLTDTFNCVVSGGSPPYTYQWLLNGGGTMTPISGGVSATKILRRYGANLIFVRVSDSAGNITCSQLEAPIARPVNLGNPEARGAGGASFEGVQVGVGNYHTSSVDMLVPAIGVPFTLEKSYNSGPFAGQVGTWRFNFEVHVRPTQDYQTSDIFIIEDVPYYVVFDGPDGAPTHFSLGADGQYHSFTPGDQSRLKEEYNIGGVPTYRLYTEDAEPLVYTFEGRKLDGTVSTQRSNVPYRLVSIKNLRGYGLTIHYLNGVQGPIPGIPRISNVTDQSGRSYSFSYDANNRISQVTANDAQLTVSYTWNSDGNILSYRDSLSHEAGVDVRAWFGYHTSGNGAKKLSSITLPRGNTPLGSITYDGSGRVVGFSRPSATLGGVSTSWPTTFSYGSGFTDIDRPGGESDIRFFHTDQVVTGVTDSYGVANRTTGLLPLSASQLGGTSPSLRTSELGMPREVTSPVGVKNTFGYSTDGRGLVTSIIQSASGSGTTFTTQVSYNFNAANNLATPSSVTDARGKTFTPQFSGFGELSAFLNPYNQGSRVTDFDAATGLPHLVDDGRGNITELLYTANGDLWKFIAPFDPDNANRETVFTYPTPNRGLPRTITDRKNYQTYIEWNAAGSPTIIRAVDLTPSSGETRDVVMTYDENGNRTSVTDRRLKTTNTDYDALDRPWRVRQPSHDGAAARPTSTTDFDSLGRAYRGTDANGNIMEQTFGISGSAAGLPESTRAWNPSSGSWETLQTSAYLADGRVSTVTDGEGITRTYAYMPAPRQHLVQRISEPAPGGFQNYTEYDYDATERVIRQTTGTTGTYSGHLPTKLFEYDDAGRLKRVCDVMDGDHSAAAWGKSTNIIVAVSYYGDDNVENITDPLGQLIQHQYDAQGRLSQRTDATPNSWQFKYDANGNLQREIFPGGRTITRTYGVLDRLESIDYGDGLNTSVTYTYDANLNRLGMTDRRGISSYGYDYLNRLTSYTRTPSGRSALSLAYTHEPAGQVKSITYPGGRVVSHTHDHLGRMKTISPWTGGSFIYTWRKDGKVDAISNPNGTSTDYQYNDPAGRLSRIFTQLNGTSIYHDYTWSPAGNILSITGDQPLANPTDAPVTLLPDAANRLSTVNGQSVITDAAGRTEAFPAPLNAFLEFEGLDWLSSLIRAGQTTSYNYDGDGVRTARTTSTSTTRYLTAPGGDMPTVMAECDDTNTPTRFHLYGATGLIATADTNGGYAVPHFNHRGDTLALTRGNTAWSATASVGSMIESYAYSPYGLTTAANATSSYPFRFIGQHGVMDEENGLHFMRARYYAASTGRFVSLDSLDWRITGELNQFRYSVGEPMNRIDPTGFDDVGCDVIPDITRNQQRCCAIHDYLYDQYTCTQNSWNPASSQSLGCKFANAFVVACIVTPSEAKMASGFSSLIPIGYDAKTDQWTSNVPSSLQQRVQKSMKQTAKEMPTAINKPMKQAVKEMPAAIYRPIKQTTREMPLAMYKPIKQTAVELPKVMYSTAKQSATEMFKSMKDTPNKAYQWIKSLWD